jgi:hypothetical protein
MIGGVRAPRAIELPQQGDEQRAEKETTPGTDGERPGVLRPGAQRRQCGSGHDVNTTLVPGETSAASRNASQFVNRTHPCDCVRPICDGSGEPWIP